jgi:hypothetical protein
MENCTLNFLLNSAIETPMLATGIIILIIVGAALLFINGTSFGSLPSSADLKKMQRLTYFHH